MGWSSGYRLLDAVANEVLPKIPDEHQEQVAEALIDLFQEHDCDTVGECENPAIVKVYRERFWGDGHLDKDDPFVIGLDEANPLRMGLDGVWRRSSEEMY